MLIKDILKILNESTELQRVIKNAKNLDKIFPKNNEINKNRFFRKIANEIEDKKFEVDEKVKEKSLRDEFLKLNALKSFSLNSNDKEGLYSLLREIDPEAYEPMLTKSIALTSGWLKGKYTNAANYTPEKGKKGRKQNNTPITSERQLSIDISTLFKRLSAIKPGTCGPDELLISILHGGKKVNGKSKEKGDIEINGKIYEVKANESGGIDTGYKEIEEKMQYAKGEEILKLRKQFEQSKKEYEKAIESCTKLAEKFAKVLAEKYNLTADDVKDYFSILTDEDKKRAIVYGFFEYGYKNLIICKHHAENYNERFDIYLKVLEEKDLRNYIYGENVSISTLGIDLIDKRGTGTKSCKFSDWVIKVTEV